MNADNSISRRRTAKSWLSKMALLVAGVSVMLSSCKIIPGTGGGDGSGNDSGQSQGGTTKRPYDTLFRPSTIPSTYTAGFIEIEESADVSDFHIKVTGVDYSGKDSIVIECVVLDEYGNQIAGLAPPNAKADYHFWEQVILKTSKGAFNVDNFRVTEVRWDVAPTTRLSMVADYSGSMVWSVSNLNEALSRAGAFIREGKDQHSIVQFDHRVTPTIPMHAGVYDPNRLKPFSELGGGTALFDGSITGLNQLRSGNERKIEVLFTDGMDNSSFIDPNEIVTRARDEKVRIYCIGLGNVDILTLWYISALTGGRVYLPRSSDDLKYIYEEILRVIQASYQIHLSKKLLDEVDRVHVIPYDGSRDDLGDTTSYYAKPIRIPIERNTFLVALFKGNSTEFDEYWQYQIDRVIDFLTSNPSYNVVLRGHTDTRGSESDNKALGKKRAEYVKRILIDKGIDSKRIKTEGIGEKEPIWANDSEEWQARENRRVDIRVVR